MVQFKTLSHKAFVYVSDFDTNGICYAIGSNYGQKRFSNPHTQGLIIIKSSRWANGKVEQILGRVKRPFGGPFHCHSDNIQNGWFSIDVGANMKIKPTHYTLRHSGYSSGYYLRIWNFEGSNNGNNWNILKRHENDASLNTAFGTQ
eukprot:327587_1